MRCLVAVAVAVTCSAGCHRLLPFGHSAGLDGAPPDAGQAERNVVSDLRVDRRAYVVPCVKAPETLNGKDDDCDGKVDEPFWAAIINVPMLQLTAQDAGCNDTSTKYRLECMIASRKWCITKGYQAGFGPVEEPPKLGDPAGVVCATNLSLENASLGSKYPGCMIGSELSDQCFQAIHQYCADKGHVSGFGPLAPITSTVLLACVDHAKVFTWALSQVTQRHPSCFADWTGKLVLGAPCRAAISRACISATYISPVNYMTGYGPIGYVLAASPPNNQVKVVCLPAELPPL